MPCYFLRAPKALHGVRESPGASPKPRCDFGVLHSETLRMQREVSLLLNASKISWRGEPALLWTWQMCAYSPWCRTIAREQITCQSWACWLTLSLSMCWTKSGFLGTAFSDGKVWMHLWEEECCFPWCNWSSFSFHPHPIRSMGNWKVARHKLISKSSSLCSMYRLRACCVVRGKLSAYALLPSSCVVFHIFQNCSGTFEQLKWHRQSRGNETPASTKRTLSGINRDTTYST